MRISNCDTKKQHIRTSSNQNLVRSSKKQRSNSTSLSVSIVNEMNARLFCCRCRWWTVFCLLCLALIFCRHVSSTTTSGNSGEKSNPHRRCRSLSSETNSSKGMSFLSPALQGYYNSTCDLCARDYPSTMVRISSNKTRAVVLFTSQQTSEKALTITAGLLTAGNRVTIITGPAMPEHHLIREVLFQSIPCEKHVIASILLTFKSYTVEQSSWKGQCEMVSCSLHNAGPTTDAFATVFDQVSEPSVLVLDATYVVGKLLLYQWEVIFVCCRPWKTQCRCSFQQDW